MRLFSVAAIAAALVSISVSANAAPLSGLFKIDIYNYDSMGKGANAAATKENVAARAKDIVARIIYRGALDFRIDTRKGDAGGSPLITEFLDTGTGGYNVKKGSLKGLVLSSGGGSSDPRFGITTLFDISARFLPRELQKGFEGSITHDDGMSLYEDGELVVGYGKPTAERVTDYSFGSGDFRLVYASANGDPSILEVDAKGVAPVPLPAPALLLVVACGALGVTARRKKA
ncbi:MAG: VPLPA-CTERM sorting domain-containing protein [Mangrovicoccus sp.]|nr:VPLPA-CTERM sorting domain-containing protein [Mangrovicoccus sp.]